MELDGEERPSLGPRGHIRNEQAGNSRLPNFPRQDGATRAHRAKAAYYNAASEKSLSHEEAKLIYQRHQLEMQQQENDAQIPLSRSTTYASTVDEDEALSKTSNTTSRKSGRVSGPRDPDVYLRPSTSPIVDTQRTGEATFESEEDGALGKSTGFMGQATSSSDISPELTTISMNIKRLLQTRHKYINLSLQGPHDNPNDGADWKIYPPPPNPTWNVDKARDIGHKHEGNTLGDRWVDPGDAESQDTNQSESTSLPMSPTAKPRKPGQDIGADFNMADMLPLPVRDDSVMFELDQDSVYQIYSSPRRVGQSFPLNRVPTLREFYMDMDEVQNISSDGPTKSFAYRQLDILEGRFHLYFLVNSYQETADSKKVPHRDFYNVRKVDTHVHHSACMNQKHLLRFIKSKMKKSPDEIVMFRDNKELTLRQVFESINLTAYDLSIDTLDMHV